MKKLSIVALMLLLSLSLVFANGSAESTQSSDGELNGIITFWHSFTQGKRMEAVQAAAEEFMQMHPGVTINIETMAWGDFNLYSRSLHLLSRAKGGEEWRKDQQM